MSKKLIIVINGKGGVGKDTLCTAVSCHYRTLIISSIDPIKAIASQHGWNGEKDNKARRFLADLKQAFTNYNGLPTLYLKSKTEEFLKSSFDILFVHIREPEQINEYKASILPHSCKTLLIKRTAIDNGYKFGNDADDRVDEYKYDYVFQNDLPIKESAVSFCKLIESIY